MIVNPIKRRPTRKIRVGSVYVGGDAPISIQSMTNTETCDVAATVAQIQRCADAGADIMRVSVPTMEAAAAFGEIRKQVTVPLVADIHFDYKIALAVLVQIVYGLTQVILVRKQKFVKWLLRHAIMIFQCELVSMQARLRKIFKRNMVNRQDRRYLSLQCVILIFWIV